MFFHKLSFLVLISYLSLSYEAESDEDKEIERETKKMLKAGCCEKDFIMLVLTKWDVCMKMNTWQFKEQPYIKCRRKLFKRDGPCNEERKDKCAKRKEDWLDCLAEATGSEDSLVLKPEFKNNNTALEEFPVEKLRCYRRALADVKCNK